MHLAVSGVLFIMLPHTITGNADLISALGGNCILFARELVSFHHIQKYSTNCQVHLDHDMAFHLDVNAIRNRTYPSIPALILKKILNKIIGRPVNDVIPSINKLAEVFIFELRSNLKKKDCGEFFRKDAEASGYPIPRENADLSVIYELSTRSREIIEYTVWLLFRYLGGFNRVKTDRLHICIASALLGKKVDFRSNSYFKCRAVYEYSLKTNFELVTWLDT
jgi:exopolysaccharide biosynthesis predicted pyruvyltransferase EpsI